MNMKRLLTLVAFFATVQASAQQVNPVPDYVFANRMSAGRNTVTDTAAYFSIGPRYGATRGMMPPMVVDTASFSANKRNGLLIFSVQKNKFLYWDSVGVKWAEMAGTGGSAITGSGVAGYMPEFTTSTNLDTTRLYHSAGRFAIGSTTTTNGVLNVYGGTSYFDTSLRVGLSTLFADEANDRIGIGTTSPTVDVDIEKSGDINILLKSTSNTNQSNSIESKYDNGTFWSDLIFKAQNTVFYSATNNGSQLERFKVTPGGSLYLKGTSTNANAESWIESDNTAFYLGAAVGSSVNKEVRFYFNGSATGERFRLFNNGRIFLGPTPSDAGYQVQVGGTLKSTTMSTDAPTGGTLKPWKLGEAATVSPTSPNRTIRVEIDGTVYYLHAKTTND